MHRRLSKSWRALALFLLDGTPLSPAFRGVLLLSSTFGAVLGTPWLIAHAAGGFWISIATFSAAAISWWWFTCRRWQVMHVERLAAWQDRGRCPRCHYALAGLHSGQCPECGINIETYIHSAARTIHTITGQKPRAS